MAHEKIKKVIASIQEVPVEPDYYAVAYCPYCNQRRAEEVFDDNITITLNCYECKEPFRVKIPKVF